MQYSTLRISTLVAVFSASTALAYLDCGGGRAPPKTTVPGCPGYVDPTAVAFTTSTSTSAVPIITATSSATDSYSWSSDSSSDDSSTDPDVYSGDYTYTGDDDGLCTCSGYLCEFAQPGCVAINTGTGARSTITANPGWESKTFDPESYLSYIATAGPGMAYSADGYAVSFDAPATELLSLASYLPTSLIEHVTRTTDFTGTATRTASARITSTPSATPSASSSLNGTTASTLSTVVSASTTTGSNTTAPTASQTVAVATTNGASKTAFSSLAALMVFGVSAMALL